MNSQRRCLVTAGPTREFFDPVRFLSNPSSGKMGYALACAARDAGWQTTLVSGPVSLPAPAGIELVRVVTGEEMFRAVAGRFGEADLLIMTAAVMDYRPRERREHKVKKGTLSLVIEMEPVVDILATVARGKRPDQTVVGFAAETREVEAYALGKLRDKNCDYIVANDVGAPDAGFEVDSNRVLVLGRDGSRRELGPAPKTEIARALMALLESNLK